MPLRASTTLFTLMLLALGTGSPSLGAGAPYLVKDINPTGFSSPAVMTKVGNRLFFNADDGVHGQELWVSDGTEAGTYMVTDLVPGADGSVPQRIVELNGKALFQVDDNVDGMQWFISDGTPQGTVSVGNVETGGPGIAFETCGFWQIESETVGTITFFEGDDSTYGKELWKTNGLPNGTVLVKDIVAGPSDGSIQTLTRVGDTLFFASGSGGSIPGLNPWCSDGTLAGTIPLADLVGAIWFTDIGGTAFFQGETSTFGEELWVSDGTSAGTYMVKDINPGMNPSTPGLFTNVNGIAYFTAFKAGNSRELWRSDGTEEGTYMVVDLNPAGSGGVGQLCAVSGTLFFRHHDAALGWQIWKSDGTAQGTVAVQTIGPPGVEEPEFLTDANGKLYFAGDDGIHGLELWVSDGTAEGTYMTVDSDAGPESFFPAELVWVGPILFFKGSTPESGGAELFALDTRQPQIPATNSLGLAILIAGLLCGGAIVVGKKAT